MPLQLNREKDPWWRNVWTVRGETGFTDTLVELGCTRVAWTIYSNKDTSSSWSFRTFLEANKILKWILNWTCETRMRVVWQDLIDLVSQQQLPMVYWGSSERENGSELCRSAGASVTCQGSKTGSQPGWAAGSLHGYTGYVFACFWTNCDITTCSHLEVTISILLIFFVKVTASFIYSSYFW